MFVNLPFNKEYRILIKICICLKIYTAQKLLNEFPSKRWNERSIRKLLKAT